MKNTLINVKIRPIAMTLVILAVFVVAKPTQVDAGFKFIRLIDPFCLTCNNDKPQTIVNNVTDSNNVINSNNSSTVVTNSPGANVSTYSAPSVSYGRNSRTPTVVNPIVADSNNYSYTNTASRVYPTTQTYSTYQQSALSVSCYSNITSTDIGGSVLWVATPSGGNGNFYVTWSGNDGLSGYGTSVSKIYNTSGSKYASVTVTSGGQTVSQNCSNNVNVRDNNYYYNGNYNYGYNYNYYNNSPLYVSCYANTTSGTVGSNMTWQATATGGTGYYTYSWLGTDYLSGYGSYINKIYNTPGTKTATVTVTSDGQTVTKMCSNSIDIGSIYYNQNYSYYPDYGYNQNYTYNQNYVYSPATAGGLQIACFPDKVSARVGTSVTWAVEAIGGNGNFTYAWTGSEGLSSNQSSVITTYGTTGKKSATVTVTSSNGQTITQACGSKVNITSAYAAPRPANYNNQNPQINNQYQQDNSLSAASLFSLKNVPWGWVAVLVILVLMFTVMYLIFNRNKI